MRNYSNVALKYSFYYSNTHSTFKSKIFNNQEKLAIANIYHLIVTKAEKWNQCDFAFLATGKCIITKLLGKIVKVKNYLFFKYKKVWLIRYKYQSEWFKIGEESFAILIETNNTLNWLEILCKCWSTLSYLVLTPS